MKTLAYTTTACVTGIWYSVLDTLTIIEKHIPALYNPCKIPYLGTLNLLTIAIKANDDHFKAAELCYVGAALVTSGSLLLKGLPFMAADIFMEQVIAIPAISYMIHEYSHFENVLVNVTSVEELL